MDDRTLARAQAASGALFALFLLVHLGNVAIAIGGPARFDAAQRTLRAGYNLAPVEVALIALPLLVHVTTTVLRILRRRRRGVAAPRALRGRLHCYAGYVLLAFTAGHVFATRGVPLLWDVRVEFAGIAFTMAWTWLFIPYYALFAVAGLYHAVNGLAVALPTLGVRPPRRLIARTTVYGVALAGSVALLLAVGRFAGWYGDVGRPQDGAYAHLLAQKGFVDLADYP